MPNTPERPENFEIFFYLWLARLPRAPANQGFGSVSTSGSGQCIRIRIRNPDPDLGGQKLPTKVEKI
jgi:hypothetical protein